MDKNQDEKDDQKIVSKREAYSQIGGSASLFFYY